MLKMLTFAAALAVAATAAAQDKKVTTADFAGTWNIEVMSHQIALVIEPAEGNKVTATMMMMGRDTLLKGELSRSHADARRHQDRGERHGARQRRSSARRPTTPPSNAKPIVVTLQEDGTIAGEMMTNSGPGEVDRREAEGEEEGLDVSDRQGPLAACGVEGNGSDGRAPIS